MSSTEIGSDIAGPARIAQALASNISSNISPVTGRVPRPATDARADVTAAQRTCRSAPNASGDTHNRSVAGSIPARPTYSDLRLCRFCGCLEHRQRATIQHSPSTHPAHSVPRLDSLPGLLAAVVVVSVARPARVPLREAVLTGEACCDGPEGTADDVSDRIPFEGWVRNCWNGCGSGLG